MLLVYWLLFQSANRWSAGDNFSHLPNVKRCLWELASAACGYIGYGDHGQNSASLVGGQADRHYGVFYALFEPVSRPARMELLIDDFDQSALTRLPVPRNLTIKYGELCRGLGGRYRSGRSDRRCVGCRS